MPDLSINKLIGSGDTQYLYGRTFHIYAFAEGEGMYL